MKLTIQLDGDTFELDVQRTEAGVRVECEGTTLDVAPRVMGGVAELRLGPKVHRVRFPADDAVEIDGTIHPFRLASFVPEAPAAAGGDHGVATVRATMPGRIIKILVAVGGHVDKGAPLFVLEAMKMQNELASPWTGRVQELVAAAGDVVEAGRVLAKIDTGVRKG